MTSEKHKTTVWEDKGMHALLEQRCATYLKEKKVKDRRKRSWNGLTSSHFFMELKRCVKPNSKSQEEKLKNSPLEEEPDFAGLQAPCVTEQTCTEAAC